MISANRRFLLIHFSCVVLLTSCSSTQTRIDGKQYAAIDGAAAHRFGLLLENYHDCIAQDSECQVNKLRRKKLQKKFNTCIATGLSRTAPHTTLVELNNWEKFKIFTLTPSQPEVPHGHFESFFELHRDLLNNAGIAYLVVMRVTSSSSDKQLLLDGAGDSTGFILGVGQQWTKSAQIMAAIYAVESGKLTGELSADLSEDAGWVVPMLMGFIPLLPVGWSPNVESTSCREMGEALGRFFSGAGNNYIND